MRTVHELEQLYAESPAPKRRRGIVRKIVVRKGGGVHQEPMLAELSPTGGLHGDRWVTDDGDVNFQVTLMMWRVAELIASDDCPIRLVGDNFLVDLDLGEASAPVGTRFRIGAALLQVTPEPHTGCKKFRDRFGDAALRWVNDKAHKALGLRGVNCRVLEAGSVAVGDAIEVVFDD